MELTELTHKKQIAAAIKRDRERQAKKMLKKEQPLKKKDKEIPIAIVATMEQEQMTNEDELWININIGVAQELAQRKPKNRKQKPLKK